MDARKYRSKVEARGARYIQVLLDPESLRILDELRGELRLRWQTSEIIKRALVLLYERIFWK
jgi:hypothetical protein